MELDYSADGVECCPTGSTYVDKFVKVFSTNAGECDVIDLMIKVSRNIHSLSHCIQNTVSLWIRIKQPQNSPM